MKRLLKAGLIEEFDDNDDKRSKRVRTTPKGAAAYVEAVQKISRVSKIVGGNLPEEKKQDIVAALDYLNSFHNAIYAQQAEASIEEILDKNVFGAVTAR
jgi:DNA-binding MarR family transcriptional regulator